MIELQDVSRRYQVGEVSVTALEEVSLSIRPGEFTVILGPSGSGKTTLLNLIGALDSPTEGASSSAGTTSHARPARSCSASAASTSRSSSRPSTSFPGSRHSRTWSSGWRPQAANGGRRLAADTLGRVGLAARLAHFPHELSGGEQQRVAIARAVATGSPVLLADEPTGELDFRTGVQILELLHEQSHDAGTSVLVVTHNREISRVAHRVIELSSGQVVSDGPPPGGQPADFSELHW